MINEVFTGYSGLPVWQLWLWNDNYIYAYSVNHMEIQKWIKINQTFRSKHTACWICLWGINLYYYIFPSPEELVSFVKPVVASFNTYSYFTQHFIDDYSWICLLSSGALSLSLQIFFFVLFWYDGFCSGYLRCLCCSCTCCWSIEASPK